MSGVDEPIWAEAHRTIMDTSHKPLSFYLAARYSRREELCTYRDTLVARGHTAPARWLLGEHQAHGVEAARVVDAAGPIPAAEARLFAEDDIADVLAADVVVSFTEPPRAAATRGGRHVELGVGLGLRRAGPSVHAPTLIVVGPLENVFHALPDIDAAFDTFEGFLAAFDALPLLHGFDDRCQALCVEHPLHKCANDHRASLLAPFSGLRARR